MQKKTEWEQAELNSKLEKERVDVSLPGRKVETGGLHPVTMTINRVTKIFSQNLAFQLKMVLKLKVIITTSMR